MAAVQAVISQGQQLKSAIDKNEAEMRPRGIRDVELSFESAEMGSDWVRFQESPIFKLGHEKEKKTGE